MGLSLDQGRGLFGPIWGPILRDPFRGIGRGPGTHFSGIRLVGALGSIWRPKADILEAEGRHYGGRRPTKWGLGVEPSEIKKGKKPVSIWIIFSRLVGPKILRFGGLVILIQTRPLGISKSCAHANWHPADMFGRTD